jgi:hypothetical protein
MVRACAKQASFLLRFKHFFFFLQHTDNELITLEVIHRYVELLDKYFGSVSRSTLTEGDLQ